MSKGFSEFSGQFSRQEIPAAFSRYQTSTMVETAKTILLESHESDSAYLGALTVLMLNGII